MILFLQPAGRPSPRSTGIKPVSRPCIHGSHCRNMASLCPCSWKSKSLSHVWLFATPWNNSPGQNTGVGSLSLLQWILPTQESNWGLLHCSGFFTNWAIREAPFSPNSTLSRRFCLLPLNQLGSFSLETALSFGNVSWWPTHSPLHQGYLYNWLLILEICKLVVCSKMGNQYRFVDLSRTHQDLRSFWW